MSAGQPARYVNPEWLTFTTEEELSALERWLTNTKQPRTKSALQIYSVVSSLITGEVERRWQRQPAKVAKKKAATQKKTRQGDTNTRRANKPTA